jgi:hypothetical protein
VNKKTLSERDICTKFITPALVAAGWDVNSQVREEVHLTAGQVIVRGRMVRRGESKFADYVLFHKPNIPIAVVEATVGRQGLACGFDLVVDEARRWIDGRSFVRVTKHRPSARIRGDGDTCGSSGIQRRPGAILRSMVCRSRKRQLRSRIRCP